MKYESRAIIKNVAQQGECKRHVNCDDVAVNAVSSQQPFPCLALPGLAFALSCPALPCPTLPYFASFFSHFATETFWYFLSTDADEFVYSSSFVVPALTKFVERESCRIYFLLLLLLPHCISIAFVAFHEPKALRLRLCSKNFASAAILHCKARATQIGLLDWRRKESFWIDGMTECIRGQGDKEDPHEGRQT